MRQIRGFFIRRESLLISNCLFSSNIGIFVLRDWNDENCKLEKALLPHSSWCLAVIRIDGFSWVVYILVTTQFRPSKPRFILEAAIAPLAHTPVQAVACGKLHLTSHMESSAVRMLWQQRRCKQASRIRLWLLYSLERRRCFVQGRDMTAKVNPACHVNIIIQWIFRDGMIRLDSQVQKAGVKSNT